MKRSRIFSSSNIERSNQLRKEEIRKNFIIFNDAKKSGIQDHEYVSYNIDLGWKGIKESIIIYNPLSRFNAHFLSKHGDDSKPFKFIKLNCDFFPSFQHYARNLCLEQENVIVMNLYDELSRNEILHEDENKVQEFIKGYELSREKCLTLFYFLEVKNFSYKIDQYCADEMGITRNLERDKVDKIIFFNLTK